MPDIITSSTKIHIEDEPGPGEGRLVITLTDKNRITIHGVRIYLHHIKRTGGNNRAVTLHFIGPKDIDIQRSDRERRQP